MNEPIYFNVKENSLQEFADKFIVLIKDQKSFGERVDKINPYYIIGKKEIFVRKQIMDVIQHDPIIVFTLADISENSRTNLINTYIYTIEPYDNLSLKLVLFDFKISIENK